MKTVMTAGMIHVAYVDDGQGRRLVVASTDVHVKPIPIAMTKAQAREVVRVIRELAEELPGEEPIQLRAPAAGGSGGV